MLLAVAGLHIGRSMGWLERSLETGQPNLLTVVLLVFFSLNLLLRHIQFASRAAARW